MQTNKPKLVIVSGPDRVGKTTWILNQKIRLLRATERLDKSRVISISHFGPPDLSSNSITDLYLKDIAVNNNYYGDDIVFWDRSYVCSYALEQIRRNSDSNLVKLIELELELTNIFSTVQHLVIKKSFNFVAKHHIAELRELNPGISSFFLARELVTRANEHDLYYKKVDQFLTTYSIFPSFTDLTYELSTLVI